MFIERETQDERGAYSEKDGANSHSLLIVFMKRTFLYAQNA
jgi:hypothetical protein